MQFIEIVTKNVNNDETLETRENITIIHKRKKQSKFRGNIMRKDELGNWKHAGQRENELE